MFKSRWILILFSICLGVWLIGMAIIGSIQQEGEIGSKIFEERLHTLENEAQVLSDQIAAKEKAGVNSENLLPSYKSLADLQWQMRRFDQSRKTLKKALAVVDTTFPQNQSADLVDLTIQLANLERDSGNYAESESLFRRALKEDEQHHAEHPDLIARDCNNLGTILYMQGLATTNGENRNSYFHEAVANFDRALGFYKENKNDFGSQLASALNNKALVLRDLGEQKKAKECEEEAKSIRSVLNNAKSR